MMSNPVPEGPRIVTGPLPDKVTITTWPKAADATRGKETTLTWSKLVERYEASGAAVKPKEDLPAPVFARVRPECIPDECHLAAKKGKKLVRHRCDDAVVEITALVLDHDDGTEWDVVVQWVRANNLSAVLYQSPSFAQDHPKWRLVLPMACPHTDSRSWRITYGRFRLFLSAQTGVQFDAKCSNPSRIFYPPTRPTEDDPARVVLWVDGGAIDLQATLATLPVPEDLPASGRARVDASSVHDLDSRERDAFERWCQGALRQAIGSVSGAGLGERNNALNKETFSLASRFVSTNLLDASGVESAMLDAGKAAGLSEHEAKTTIASAMTGGKANATLIHDLISEWRRKRTVVPFPKLARGPEDPPAGRFDDESEQSEETNGFTPGSQALAPLLPGIDEHLVCPRGFQLRRAEGAAGERGELVLAKMSRKRGTSKPCEECGVVNVVKATTCTGCGADLTSEPPSTEELTNIAHVPIWIGSELTSATPDGNLLEVCAVVDAKRISRIVPRGLIQDPRKLAIALEGAGVALYTSKSVAFDIAGYLSQFLQTNRLVLPRKRATVRLGWDPDMRGFLLGEESVGADDLVLYSGTGGPDRSAGAFRCAGAVGEWLSTAEQFVSVSPAGALALAAAAASPMLRALAWPPIGVVLGGLGGTGKTAILSLAGSAFGATGDPSSRQANGVVGNGIATLNALVGQFLPLADLPHLADEVRVNASDARSRSDTEAALHALIDGQGRARLRRDSRGTIATECSPGCAVLGTETDPSEFIRKGGAMRRYLCPRPPYGEALGRFRKPLAHNHGHAGRALIHALVSTTVAKRSELSKLRAVRMAELREGLTPSQRANESIRTWCEQIGVALAAVDVVTELCPGLWPEPDGWKAAILSAWLRILDDPGDRGEQGDPVAAAYDRTVEWVASHRAHLVPSAERMRWLAHAGDIEKRKQSLREPIVGRVFEAVDEDSADEQLLVVDVYQTRLTEFAQSAGYSLRTMGKEWADRGWLRRSAKDNAVDAKIGGVRVSVYRVVMPQGAEDA